MGQIKVNNISMYYEVHGQGEPIVFIAGFGADHTVWSELIARFKDTNQVIVFDNRGAGQTQVPDGPYTVEQMAEDVVELCFKLGIKNAHFVGNSMGGFILQVLAYRYSSLVKSATISHSAATAHTPFAIYVQAHLDLLKLNIAPEALIKALCAWLFSFQFLNQPGVLEQLILMGIENPYPFTINGYEGQQAALNHFDSTAWLHEIKVPTLVLSSDQDLIFKASLAKHLAEHIPHAQYYCFSECGHLPQLEYPQKLTEIIQDFIAKSSR